LVRCALPEAVEELAVLAHDPRPQRPGHAGERARVAVAVVLAAVVHRDRLARLRADDARAGPAAVALVLADEHDVRVREEADAARAPLEREQRLGRRAERRGMAEPAVARLGLRRRIAAVERLDPHERRGFAGGPLHVARTER